MAIEIVDSPIVIFHSYVNDYQRGLYVSEYCESCVDATDKRPVLLVYFHVRMQFPYSVTYPPVSSNVAIVNPLEIGISIAKSSIHRQCMFNCHVWLPEGTVHDRNRSLWKAFMHSQWEQWDFYDLNPWGTKQKKRGSLPSTGGVTLWLQQTLSLIILKQRNPRDVLKE